MLGQLCVKGTADEDVYGTEGLLAGGLQEGKAKGERLPALPAHRRTGWGFQALDRVFL